MSLISELDFSYCNIELQVFFPFDRLEYIQSLGRAHNPARTPSWFMQAELNGINVRNPTLMSLQTRKLA